MTSDQKALLLLELALHLALYGRLDEGYSDALSKLQLPASAAAVPLSLRLASRCPVECVPKVPERPSRCPFALSPRALRVLDRKLEASVVDHQA